MKRQLKIIVILLFWLNMLMTIRLIRDMAEPASAIVEKVYKIDVVRVGGKHIYNAKLPVEYCGW